ncbi:hypothetical protein KFL_007650040 [Klebsormidium nitens]|uniref:Sugar phosphate transporter domain-containing protein n=1 Tax=Klebsormidium nitens TaxID=105231 RepID=A0A1Y1IKM9_KLENI|nr:hypothetical protein KFL_007650040 [Klebsormidium nitens]|eukprot:GAQ91324.1 hypothetical protein KFL_007650040 [Klebsormidium nitens]
MGGDSEPKRGVNGLLSKLTPKELMGLAAALLYGAMSVSMAFVNKGLLMEYPFPNVVLTLQMAATAAIIVTGQRLRWFKVRPWDNRVAKSLLPLVFLYNANVAFALASLQTLNIPMYVTLKRLTPVVVLFFSFLRGKGRPSLQVSSAVLLTVAGTLLAGFFDLSFDLAGYAMAFTSVLLQAGYLLMVEKSGAEEGLNTNELLLYNSAMSLPVLLVIVGASGELSRAHTAFGIQMLSSWTFFPTLLVSLLLGSLLNFTLFLNTLVNSALTTTIVGVLKGVVSTVLGFFLLGGVKLTLLGLFGILINTTGGVWYSFAKFYEKRGQAARPKGEGVASEPLLPVSTNPGPRS